MARTPHPLAGRTIRIKLANPADDPHGLDSTQFRLEDWWINVAGKSWMFCDGNPACLIYAVRSAAQQLPTDNEVVYGKVGGYGCLVHTSELGEVLDEV